MAPKKQPERVITRKLGDGSTEQIKEVKDGLIQEGNQTLGVKQSRVQTQKQAEIEAVNVEEENELSEHIQISESSLNTTIVQSKTNGTQEKKMANLTEDALKSWQDQGVTNSLSQSNKTNSSQPEIVKSNATFLNQDTVKQNASMSSEQRLIQSNATNKSNASEKQLVKSKDPLLEHSIDDGEIQITSNQT